MVALVALGVWIVGNTIDNLARQNIASGFDFLGRTAGFDISQSLIAYANTSTYGRAFWSGCSTRCWCRGLGIVLATVVGVLVGHRAALVQLAHRAARDALRRDGAQRAAAAAAVRLVLRGAEGLPAPRQSRHALRLGAFLNVRGLYLPDPIGQPGIGSSRRPPRSIGCSRSRSSSGRGGAGARPAGASPAVWTALGLILGVPLAVFALTGAPLTFDMPRLKGFNFEGGLVVQPEFLALLLGLSVYTAAFIAEIVRSGIQGVPKGQKEAAAALGLSRRPGDAPRRHAAGAAHHHPAADQPVPQPDQELLARGGDRLSRPRLGVRSGTVLNQTDQAVEVILITMAVYLTLSLCDLAGDELVQRRMALVER